MHTSIASYRPQNHERDKVRELIPQYLRDGASNLISFMEEYYDYLNREGFASYELAHVINENDIDFTSEKYLDAIQGEIAKIVPSSSVIDRTTLYKRIVHYYSVKGTPESVHVFFQMMFDSIVEVYYPSDNLFKLSAGTYNQTTDLYTKRNGDLSGIDKIQDSFFWQDFSYQIKATISTERWINSFERMVHPAGMKFFVLVLVEAAINNRWEEFQSYTGTANNPESWLKDLRPPVLRGVLSYEAYHTPKYQPGWLSSIIAGFVTATAENYYGSLNLNDSSFDRVVFFNTIFNFINSNWSNSTNSKQYFNRGFWDDPATLNALNVLNTPLSILINEYQQEYAAGRLESAEAPQPLVQVCRTVGGEEICV